MLLRSSPLPSVLEEPGPGLFGVRVRSDSSARHRWEIAGRSGGMIATRVGGPLTGRGADILVIDDYCENSDEAAFQT